jgi:hypothetical protein
MPEVNDLGVTRDIWSHGAGRPLPEFLASCLSTLLLLPKQRQPAYFSSPWMSDFPLFDNRFGAFAALLPALADQSAIRFSEYLAHLSETTPVRIITTRSETSLNFLQTPALLGLPGLQWRFAPDEYHEKGILAPSFYIEGSMNITHNGIFVRGEKITYHTEPVTGTHPKIGAAYLEFERRWNILR